MDMVEFIANIGDPTSGKTFKTKVTKQNANQLLGKKIGDEMDGIFVGLPGYKLRITGGSDSDGFPMRPELNSSRRSQLLLTKSIGFRSQRIERKKGKKYISVERGLRKRKRVCGNVISPKTIQINIKVVAGGSKPIGEALAAKDKE